MVSKVFALDSLPGVQRDGTVFDKNYYTAGRWVRFQRGRPRKILGYREITPLLNGPSRGIYVSPQNQFNYVFNGYSDGLQVIPIDNNGAGSGLVDFTLTDFTADADNLWQFDSLFDAAGTGNATLLASPAQNLSDINNSTNTPVLAGNIAGTTMSKIGVFTAIGSFISGASTITLAAANNTIGAGQTVTGTGIQAGTTVVSIVSTTVTISLPTTATGTSATITFDNNVSVSGGVVVLHPYVFVYGNNGLIRNCAAGNTNDWISNDSNESNVSSTKVVQGLPVRGGSNAPSGLFWTLDSLVRVSYTPTTVTIGATASTFYWRYDIISSQSSILSSQSVIEYDGIYYWCGVDRFLLYNGVVKEIPNSMNQNYFFDNLNYAQRQKIYATKVPRFGEIWWFFPSGESEECNDCIIYNIRENCWYDGGEAMGARRSAGYFSQVFHYPINASTEPSSLGAALSISAQIVNIPNTFLKVFLKNHKGRGTGSGAIIDIIKNPSGDYSIKMVHRGQDYKKGDLLEIDLAMTKREASANAIQVPQSFSGIRFTVNDVTPLYSLYQHEFGLNAIKGGIVTSIDSYFETNDLGFVSGGPSQPNVVGDNRWIRLEWIEPDFIQQGEMTCYVTGRPYAQAYDQTSAPFLFNPDTHKIDMKEQRRELRLRFQSNVINGNYETGRILLAAMFGDTRGY